MSETTFENAKVGDKVWSITFGHGEIISIEHSPRYPIYVRFDGHVHSSFKVDGRRVEGENRTLFWDEIKITPPERPKRKVKKVVEGWVNIYRNGDVSDIHATNRDADCAAGPGRLGNAFHIHHEYEIEE